MEDESINHFATIVTACNYTYERLVHDYGYDAAMYTYDASGEFENGAVYIQLKATNGVSLHRNRQTFGFTVTREHLRLWTDAVEPVILIVYDTVTKVAYWLDVKEYIAQNSICVATLGKTKTLHLDTRNVLDMSVIHELARKKNAIYSQMREWLAGLSNREESRDA